MLIVVSPAKSLDYESPLPTTKSTQPKMLDRSAELIDIMRTKSADEVARLMSISPSLAQLNVDRYADWEPKFTRRNSRQALLAFNGDVYSGMSARTTFSADDFAHAQKSFRILSGLYGLLRPLDLMMPYRLEMGTTLKVGRANNLYQYWGTRISEHLNEHLQSDAEPIVVNLASQEYFKAVDLKALKATVVECVFEDFKNGEYKVISFFAKRARGTMARFALQRRVTTVRQLQSFADDGYTFAANASDPARLVFRRKIEA